jgi:hypothetical protein
LIKAKGLICITTPARKSQKMANIGRHTENSTTPNCERMAYAEI